MKSTLDLLERVIYRHGNCSYNALRDITCPSKLKRPEREVALDASIILVCLERCQMLYMQLTTPQELLSEESIYMSSQRSTSFLNTSLEPACPPTGSSKCKPRFAEFACSFVEVITRVSAFGVLFSSLGAGFPVRCPGNEGSGSNGFLGRRREFPGSYEWCVLLTLSRAIYLHRSALNNFISYRRYETMSLPEIMRGLSTSTCKWNALSTASTTHIPVSDNLKRRELLEEFIVWYFGSFVSPLLRVSGTVQRLSRLPTS